MIEIKCVEYDISLKWFMLRYCNFNCPGCIEGTSNMRRFTAEDLQIQQEQAERTGEKILDFIRSYENKNIKMTITGGECSLLDLEKIFNNGWDNLGQGNTLHMIIITNFSASNHKYKSFFRLLDSLGITYTMTASIHDSQWINPEYVINKIIDVKDYIGCVNYVINDENKNLILKYFKSLEPYVKQRMGVERNGKVKYLVSDEVWDIIKQCDVKKQIRWTEDGILERLDMDTMLNERIDENGFYGWTCYPVIKIEPSGDAFICKHKKVKLDKNCLPQCIICDRKNKCTPYNFIKVVKE